MGVMTITLLLVSCIAALLETGRVAAVENPMVVHHASNHWQESPAFRRATSPTNICTRWAQQSALVNGTLYIYGGQATTSAGQSSNTWNNDFLTLDLTKTWQITTPLLDGLAQPDGPPAVALGTLWNSYEALYLYGGEFSDNPVDLPTPFVLWQYDITTTTWSSFANPVTSAGINSPDASAPIQRAAEGAGFSVAAIGRGWYFGGHQDYLTTAGWSIDIARIYLDSMIEYTFPGQANKDITGLSNGAVTGSQGAWRNLTLGTDISQAEYPKRADGVLVFIPGFGAQGILIGLAGGTNDTFNEMNVLDVYDIETSTWYKQATTGQSPNPRVNPCAVVAAAADGSSYNLYMYGGQDLTPAGEQTQYSDIWILTIPSFTWLQVDTTDLSNPPARAGQTCNIWDAQMVVVGGYVGDISCDMGFYVFDLSRLQWINQFISTSNTSSNPQSQQQSQIGKGSALAGSYGYRVPDIVISAIGGSPTGGATVTKPVQTVTGGPLASGTPSTYGSSPTPSQGTKSGSGSSSNSSSSSSPSSSSSNIIAIVVGTLAGILGVIAIYLGFCVWLYRKRLEMYKRHADLFHRHANEQMENTSSHESSLHQPIISRAENKFWNDYHPVSTQSATARSSTEDLIAGQEPNFVGIVLHPRQCLRVVNHD